MASSSLRTSLLRTLALVMVVLTAMVMAPGAARAQTATGEAAAYTLAPGDKLRVNVFGHEDLSGEFEIDANGFIVMPLIGNVGVGGRSVSDAEIAIVNALRPDYLVNPRVSVDVLNYRPIFILGEVKEPGTYPYSSGMTVLRAVALAGGYTYRARENRVYITRAGGSEDSRQEASNETLVRPGDIIEVPERFF